MCLCGPCCAFAQATCCIYACCSLGSNRTLAKILYGVLFLVTTILAWIIRDFSSSALEQLSVLSGCSAQAPCLGAEGVLRVSLGLSVFFLIMFATTVGTKVTDDWRDTWHNGWWFLKFILWFVLCLLPFWIPSGFFQAYAQIARVGGILFLVVQIISIINFCYEWNTYWAMEWDKWWIPIVIVTIGSYILALTGIIVMYVKFAPHATCGLNIFYITFCLGIIVLMSLIPFIIKESDSNLMVSGCMSVYIMYLCWSAIMAEPTTYTCNTIYRLDNFTTITSFILSIICILLAVYYTGMDSKSFSFKRFQEATQYDVAYGYGFFHFIFMLGSMYMAMLLLGWDLNQTISHWGINQGWVSVWVLMLSSWFAATLYVWTMIAPKVLSGRSFV
eukprot:TRINITY_DN16568_c0_g1_i1.p1 TRINITY_DN16568_c0_g1~~TRINITY_DN16568_c0_g1_i1.p1  ORF type:complete len:388 (+),score=28.38 TRINITY_DN16568_c0_g1_i1:831-1994(+)